MPRAKDNMMMPTTAVDPSDLLVVAAAPEHLAAARRLAEHLGARLGASSDELADVPLGLVFDEEGLALAGAGMTLRADLTDMKPRLKPANLNRELLVKAAKIKGAVQTPLAIDATAGFGQDSLLLAAAGFRVRLYERDPVIAALLADAVRRASLDPDLAEVVARMQVVEGDSACALRRLPEPPDVVYLDPMFPERRKSAAVKKKFQLLHLLERPCMDQDELMGAAMAAAPRKIVVKRPLKGPYLAGAKPSYSISGKAIRYDCLVMSRPAG